MPIEVHRVTPMLSVWDMPASIAFYRDVLGCEVVQSSGPVPECGWAMLRLGGAWLMLNTMYDDDQRPPEKDPAHVRAHHDTVLYFGSPDVDAMYEHLRTHGIDCRPPKTAYYGMYQLYFHDPDNYNLCFQWPADEITRAEPAAPA